MPNTKAFTVEEINQILEQLNAHPGARLQYIGSRYVPVFGRKGEDSIEWDNSGTYEPLTIVLYQGNSYTSRQFVPVGIEIGNEAYWANTGNYNAQVEQYRQDVQQYAQKVNAIATDYCRVFETAADMAASELEKGMVVKTNGRAISGDGGNAFYVITDSATPNGMDAIECANGVVAELIIEKSITLESLGATGDGVNDDSDYLARAVELSEAIELVEGKNYKLTAFPYQKNFCLFSKLYENQYETNKKVPIVSGLNYEGGLDYSQFSFSVKNIRFINCSFKNVIGIMCDNCSFERVTFGYLRGARLYNCQIYNCDPFITTSLVDSIVDNCTFTSCKNSGAINSSVYSSVITNNRFQWCSVAMALKTCTDTLIADNWFDRNDVSITFSNSTVINLMNNIFRRSVDSFLTGHIEGCLISGNSFICGNINDTEDIVYGPSSFFDVSIFTNNSFIGNKIDRGLSETVLFKEDIGVYTATNIIENNLYNGVDVLTKKTTLTKTYTDGIDFTIADVSSNNNSNIFEIAAVVYFNGSFFCIPKIEFNSSGIKLTSEAMSNGTNYTVYVTVRYRNLSGVLL